MALPLTYSQAQPRAAARFGIDQLTALATPLLPAVYFASAVYFLLHGSYVNDEGFYCLIARDVWHRRLLYSDIRFTQMRLLPYVYGLFLHFLPARIDSGRWISIGR